MANLWSDMCFSAFAQELARDSDKIFNLSTCSKKQYKAASYKQMPQEMPHLQKDDKPLN